MRIVLIGLVLIAIVAGASGYYVNSRIAVAVESSATRALATGVRVGDVRPGWDAGPIVTLRDVVVDNPEGFSDEAAIHIARVHLRPSGWYPDGRFDRITLDGFTLRLEKRRGAMNFLPFFSALDRVHRRADAPASGEGIRIAHVAFEGGHFTSHLGPAHGRAGLLDRGLQPMRFAPGEEGPVRHDRVHWSARIADGLLFHSLAAVRGDLPPVIVQQLDVAIGDRPDALAADWRTE